MRAMKLGSMALAVLTALTSCTSVKRSEVPARAAQPAASVSSAKPASGKPGAEKSERIAPLSAEDARLAAADYERYCALCHGQNRAGHANDEAPSLKSRALFETGFPWPMVDVVWFGRPGTAMGGYLEDGGGPMTREEIRRLLTWLRDQVERETGREIVRVKLGHEPVRGDVRRGGEVYAKECATCHGDQGQGGLGTALGNAAMLTLTDDAFLRHAIAHGRDGTPMEAFKDKLSERDIDNVTAYLRSKASGWTASTGPLDAPPPPSAYVLNPDGKAPRFDLKQGLYVTAADLERVLNTKPRIVLLDTRVTSMWQQGHIAGAVPIPYYSSREQVIQDLPRDGTWIVAYCECPRAAAESVVKKLREQGFKNTAVLWEGIGGWVTQGRPVVRGTLANTHSGKGG